MQKFLTLPNLIWSLLYIAMVAVIVWQMSEVRTSLMVRLSTPEAQADWEQWRTDTTKPGPVARRQPKSTEPPALVLMRDYHGICLGAAVFFSSLLFLVTMLLVRGAFGKSTAEVENRSSFDSQATWDKKC